METYYVFHYGSLKPTTAWIQKHLPPKPYLPQLCISDLTEVLSVFSGVDGFGHGCFGAGFAFNLLLVHLSILDLWVAQDSLAGAETESAKLGSLPTHITGLLAGLLRHLVSRCEMCRKTAFTSLMPIFFRVGVLQREKDPDPAVERSLLWNLFCGAYIANNLSLFLGQQHLWRVNEGGVLGNSLLVSFFVFQLRRRMNAAMSHKKYMQTSTRRNSPFNGAERGRWEASVHYWPKHWLVSQSGNLVWSWRGSCLFLWTAHTLLSTAE